ncbi:hypothetical protein MPDQ_008050 [Monascus purpureus]|uniref:Cyclin-D1-binding protein 1-like N-terminal domain-containing protein n=1 Tax=Monascus purpureus TaxID=5098 RepID=A0A507QSL6_MONPU|nr:hypothetical protein MPDQ_008050 [Monascus purpureus]BDD54958.1 hypothetical protein MAP00_000522 [Monascus purpureus]
MSRRLSILIATTLELSQQFQTTLSPPSANPAVAESPNKDNALPLLSASSTALKSQVTKLSLLAITSPFTHSAIATVLSDLNTSILPSLVTAALLITPNAYTKAFHSEIRVLVKSTLKELSVLVQEVKNIVEQKDKAKAEDPKRAERQLSQSEKDVITVATGRVWEPCDALIDVAGKGVIGFVIRRVEEWRNLVKDAVEEIEEWDPGEGNDDFLDDLLSDSENGEDYGVENSRRGDQDEEQKAALQEQKKTTIRILKPIAQVFPAIVKNRLSTSENPTVPSSRVEKLELLMLNLQSIPNYVDEVAGALYEANLENSSRYLMKARACAAKAIDLVVLPWDVNPEDVGDQPTPEDKFTVWSKTWWKVVDEVSRSIVDGTEKTNTSR